MGTVRRKSAVLGLAAVIAVLAYSAPALSERDDPKAASAAAKAKGVAARKALLDQEGALMEDGVWECCMKPGCSFCQTAVDGCPCAANLRQGQPVCPCCWGGWQAGHGRLSGVKPEQVKVLSKDKLKAMYDARAKKLAEAEK